MCVCVCVYVCIYMYIIAILNISKIIFLTFSNVLFCVCVCVSCILLLFVVIDYIRSFPPKCVKTNDRRVRVGVYVYM